VADDAKAGRTIEIPEIALARLVVTIEGETPLITHRFGERARKTIEDRQQRAARTARPPRDPVAEMEDALYRLGEDRYGFPTAGVKKSLILAGGRFADEQMTVLRGVVNVLGDLLEIRGPGPTVRADPVRPRPGCPWLPARPSTLASCTSSLVPDADSRPRLRWAMPALRRPAQRGTMFAARFARFDSLRAVRRGQAAPLLVFRHDGYVHPPRQARWTTSG
jgi:hypothetical protein